MAKLEIIISDEHGNVMSIFDVMEANAISEITDVNLADEVKDALEARFNVFDK